MVGVAEGGDPDGPAFERRHRVDGAGLRRGGCEREQRQPPGGRHPADRGPVGGRLQRDVERRAGVIDGAAHQRLHCRVPAAGVDELDGQPLLGKAPARPRHLVGHDAQELAAEGQPDGGVSPSRAAHLPQPLTAMTPAAPTRLFSVVRRSHSAPGAGQRRSVASDPARGSETTPQQLRVRGLAAAHGGDHTTRRRPCYDRQAPMTAVTPSSWPSTERRARGDHPRGRAPHAGHRCPSGARADPARRRPDHADRPRQGVPGDPRLRHHPVGHRGGPVRGHGPVRPAAHPGPGDCRLSRGGPRRLRQHADHLLHRGAAAVDRFHAVRARNAAGAVRAARRRDPHRPRAAWLPGGRRAAVDVDNRHVGGGRAPAAGGRRAARRGTRAAQEQLRARADDLVRLRPPHRRHRHAGRRRGQPGRRRLPARAGRRRDHVPALDGVRRAGVAAHDPGRLAPPAAGLPARAGSTADSATPRSPTGWRRSDARPASRSGRSSSSRAPSPSG